MGQALRFAAADAVAKLRRGLAARSSVAESCGLEAGRREQGELTISLLATQQQSKTLAKAFC